MLDSKTSKPHTFEGALKISGPNELRIVEPDQTEYIYDFAEIGGKLHISVAKVYAVETHEAFEIPIGRFAAITRTAEGCKHTDTFGPDDPKVIDIECSIVGEGAEKRFVYSAPSRYDKAKMEEISLHAVDGYLATDQFMSEVATKKAVE